jgi:hypothetical protein
MAIQFLNNLNINDNQLLNAKVQVASTAPTAAKGQIYLDSTTGVNTLKYHDGSEWIGLKQLNLNNSTFVNLTNLNASGSNVISLQASLNATGTPDNTKYLRGDNTWSAISGIYSFSVSDGTTSSQVLNADTVTFNGTANEVTVSQASRIVTIGLPDNVTVAGVLTVSGAGRSIFTGQVTIPETPLLATDAASKAYVDLSTTGALIFQGGYNAATNTPNLDSPPTGVIKKGFMWTVTADGLFFGEQVRIGDSLIANIDTPTILNDWTRVQGNTDLATLTTVGIGNVNAGNGIEVTYSNGTATVTAAASAYAVTISASGTITHNMGTRDVIIELYDTVTFETVYADIARTTTNTATITFAATPTNPIRVLVKK